MTDPTPPDDRTGDADPLDLAGIVPPTVTAFDDDESVDPATTATHARFVVDEGVHGVFPLGTNGEFALLDADERVRVVEAVVGAVGDEVPVLAGVGAPDTRRTVHNAERAVEAGADGLVVVTPYYYPVDEAGLVAHYRRVAEAVDRPIYVYNIPKRTGNRISLSALDRLFAIDGVVGCKDSSGDVGWLGQAIRAHPDRTFVAGSDALLCASFALGCSGAVSAVANVFPGLVVDLYEAAADGDDERALALQERVFEIRAALKDGPYLAGVKAALSLRGFDVGPVRGPLRSFDDEERDRLAETIRELYDDDELRVDA